MARQEGGELVALPKKRERRDRNATVAELNFAAVCEKQASGLRRLAKQADARHAEDSAYAEYFRFKAGLLVQAARQARAGQGMDRSEADALVGPGGRLPEQISGALDDFYFPEGGTND